MIELDQTTLRFSFPEVHPEAKLHIHFYRTLRIPDDGQDYPLPPGLGMFPLRHVDDYLETLPATWLERGGVMLPMYQSEAMWLSFRSNYISERRTSYPFAIKIAAGKINAVTGEAWSEGMHRQPQDYVVAPRQPWLDGFCVERGIIRQFVAMPLGEGYTAEEQLTGEAEHGGLQIAVCPMRREVFERRFPVRPPEPERDSDVRFSVRLKSETMGLAPGGRMRQEIYDDPYKLEDWAEGEKRRCFVHLANSIHWQRITGERPPHPPFTAQDYTERGLPWFDYYADHAAVDGLPALAGLKCVFTMGQVKGQPLFSKDRSVSVAKIIELRRNMGEQWVREGD